MAEVIGVTIKIKGNEKKKKLYYYISHLRPEHGYRRNIKKCIEM